MKWLSFIAKVLGALLLGLFIATVWFSNDERCAVLLHNKLQQTFHDQFGAHLRAQVKSYTFFPLAVEFEDVTVRSLEMRPDQTPTWWYKAHSMKLQLSLFSYLYSGYIDMYSSLQGVTSSTYSVQGCPAILDHVKSMIIGVDVGLPVNLQAISLVDVQADFIDEEALLVTTISCDAQVKKSQEGTVIRTLMKYGSITHKNTVIVDDIRVKMSGSLDKQQQWTGSLQGSFSAPLLEKEDQAISLQGVWHNDRCDVKCFNAKRTLLFLPVSFFKEKDAWYVEGQGTIPLYALGRYASYDFKKKFDGALHLSLQGSMQSCKGVLSLSDVAIGGHTLQQVTGAFSYADNALHGTLDIKYDQQKMHGTWQVVNNFSQASCALENTTDFFAGIFKYWYCKAHNASVQFAWDQHKGTSAEYAVQFDHQKLDATVTSKGVMAIVDDRVTITGSLNDQTYTVAAKTDPFSFVSLTYADKQGEPIGSLHYNTVTKKVTGTVGYDTISYCIKTLTHIALPGSGTLEYNGVWNYPVLSGELRFKEGVVRVSGWYNFISGLKAPLAVDVQTLKIVGKDCSATLHKGHIESPAWVVQLDLWDGLVWAHVPWAIKGCFINWKKDLYAVLSGSFLFTKQGKEKPSLHGFLSLDRSQLRANILSSALQKTVIPVYQYPFDLALGLRVFSEQPVEVLASQVETKAALDLDVKGVLSDPLIEGRIALSEGLIRFPAHTLNIVRGSLTFVPHRLYDPIVELIAQNRIKKYLVTLAVSGTVQDPHIALDSSPPLSEQQILLLLFGGSEEESLKSMVPALLMRNIETLLFASQPALSAYTLPSWLDPLRKVTFVPQFTDQTARGGFKGAIEIEVSKRLRAIIEKNFSLTEDTAVKVDYLLSDDVSLRAVRDARGDLGAAIEMRFKF